MRAVALTFLYKALRPTNELHKVDELHKVTALSQIMVEAFK